MAIQSFVLRKGVERIGSFFKESGDLRPRFLRLGASAPFNIKKDLNWVDTESSVRSTNSMANSNEFMWRIPANQALPTELRIIMNTAGLEAGFGRFIIEGGTQSFDDVLLYNSIQLTLNT